MFAELIVMIQEGMTYKLAEFVRVVVAHSPQQPQGRCELGQSILELILHSGKPLCYQ